MPNKSRPGARIYRHDIDIGSTLKLWLLKISATRNAAIFHNYPYTIQSENTQRLQGITSTNWLLSIATVRERLMVTIYLSSQSVEKSTSAMIKITTYNNSHISVSNKCKRWGNYCVSNTLTGQVLYLSNSLALQFIAVPPALTAPKSRYSMSYRHSIRRVTPATPCWNA